MKLPFFTKARPHDPSQDIPPVPMLSPPSAAQGKLHKGFAALSVEQRKRIAAMGGAASHAAGTAHCWTKEEASAAGKKGSATRRKRAEESA